MSLINTLNTTRKAFWLRVKGSNHFRELETTFTEKVLIAAKVGSSISDLIEIQESDLFFAKEFAKKNQLTLEFENNGALSALQSLFDVYKVETDVVRTYQVRFSF